MGTARGAIATIVLVLATAACGRGGGPEPAPSATSAPERMTTTTGPPAGGTTMPAVPEVLRFTAAAVGGGQVSGADYAGKDVAMWFWAPW